MKKLMCALIALLLSVTLAFGMISIRGAVKKILAEGTELDLRQSGLKVLYIKIVTPQTDGSENRSYFVVYSGIQDDKLYPLRFDLVKENWKLIVKDNREVYVITQIIMVLDMDGNMHQCYQGILIESKDGEVLSNMSQPLDEVLAYEILSAELELLLNHSGRV